MDATPDRSFLSWMTTNLPSDLIVPFGNSEILGRAGKVWVQEFNALIAARLRANADALVAIGACANLVELVQVQQRWLNDAGVAYTQASHRLLRFAMDAEQQLNSLGPAKT